MKRWLPWLAALVLWNGAFDLQVRRAGEAFTADQLSRWRDQQPPALIRDAFAPRVRDAAWRATALTSVILLLGLAIGRYAAGSAHR
jgi:hypothetical protein